MLFSIMFTIQKCPFLRFSGALKPRILYLCTNLRKTIMTVFAAPANISCCRARGQNLIACESFVRVVMIPRETGREQLSQQERGDRPDHWTSSRSLWLISGDMEDSPWVNFTIDNISACYIPSSWYIIIKCVYTLCTYLSCLDVRNQLGHMVNLPTNIHQLVPSLQASPHLSSVPPPSQRGARQRSLPPWWGGDCNETYAGKATVK